LLHQEIHVYFITPDRQLILQHRAKDKDTYPNLIDATVGGHVEIGDSYEQTAIKEAGEETGWKIDPLDLIDIGLSHRCGEDPVTGKINNAMRQSYIYIFRGYISQLRPEKGKGQGFVSWSLDELIKLDGSNRDRFIPYILDFVPILVKELGHIKII
jgi:8-oxo-dGTP pyrophosphatase MutT (NUDIX family)